MSESLIFLSESVICSFLDKKQAIRKTDERSPSPAILTERTVYSVTGTHHGKLHTRQINFLWIDFQAELQ